MFDKERFFQQLESVSLDRYEMRYNELQALLDKNECDLLAMSCDAFRYGFIKGQRAERNRRRKAVAING